MADEPIPHPIPSIELVAFTAESGLDELGRCREDDLRAAVEFDAEDIVRLENEAAGLYRLDEP